MVSYKIYLILASVAIVNANFNYESFDHGSEDSGPWPFDDLVQPAASQLTQYPKSGSNYGESTDDAEPYYGSSTKTIPREDKTFKKPIYPYHSTEGDGAKFKPLFKPGSPYCREVKNEKSKDGSLTCYECKDPSTGINYKHCSQASKTKSPLVSTRIRRSHSERTSSEEEDKSFALPEDYHFGEEYFLPQATRNKEYKSKDETCERVEKDGMVCMVCKNQKTNGKYEQCSYVIDPKEKAYAYTKSSSFGRPSSGQQGESTAKKPVRVDRGRGTHQAISDESSASEDSAEDEPDSWEKSHERPSHARHNYGSPYDTRKNYKKSGSSAPATAESTACKKIEKDGQVCTICKDPKTGGNSEKCYYEYQPNDKIYKFSRSKTFGYPQSTGEKSSEESSEEESESNPKKSSTKVAPSKYKDYGYESSYDGDDDSHSPSESKSDYEYNPSFSIYESESEKIEKEAKSADCHEVKKDSMVCTVCKNPKTGGNSERCTYSYQPNDKLFTYSKSKSFGNPTQSQDRADYNSNEDSDESSDETPKSTEDYKSQDYKYSESKPVETKEKNKQGSGYSSEWGSQPAQSSKVDTGYFDTSKRKAEIEKFLEEFKAEDRSKCQKIMRDKMTCYQCIDDNGFQKEECMYVTDPIEPIKKVKREPAKEEVLKPMASASYESHVRIAPPREKKSTKKSEDQEKVQQQQDEPLQEADPYDTASETRYRYDKVLGFSLPEYMLETSEQEAEFDEIVAAGF